MGTILGTADAPASGAGALAVDARDRRRRSARSALPFVLAVVLVRLVLIRLPLTSDEGGYLLAASQWHHGDATYGDYFVDRPPLLMAIYAVADLAGGGLALRSIGIVAAAVSVLLAGRLGGRTAAAATAVLLLTPLFGTTNVDGELVALPFLLGGMAALVGAITPSARHPVGSATAAGAMGAAALLIKQDLADVFVAAGAAGALLVFRGSTRVAARTVVAGASGALAVVVAALGWAWLRGTTPARLWDALVTFRVQAGSVISANGGAAGGTVMRLHGLLLALLASGAPLVAAAAVAAGGRVVLPLRREPGTEIDPRLLALPVLAWESACVLLGGSYWRHYLIGLIPGLVLLLAAVPVPGTVRSPGSARRRVLVGTVVLAATSTLIALVGPVVGVLRGPAPGPDAEVAAYLAAHRGAGSTVVVAFGHPDIVYAAGMSSPYEHLWSLSARVRDPDLRGLLRVVRSQRPPQGLVVAGTSLGTWGVNAAEADREVGQRYRLVATAGGWRVLELR